MGDKYTTKRVLLFRILGPWMFVKLQSIINHVISGEKLEIANQAIQIIKRTYQMETRID